VSRFRACASHWTAVQIPTLHDLNGVQDEDPVYDLGFTYLVGRESRE
jgi:hypothetical protein